MAELRPDQHSIRAVLEVGRRSLRPFPEDAGPVLALMQVFWDGTITAPRRIRGTAAGQTLRAAIEGRVKFGPTDYGFILRDAGRMAQYLPNPEPALRMAITARNHSAATSIERYLGRTAWWHKDARLDPAPVTNGRRPKRRRLFHGAELIVAIDGTERRARVTGFNADVEIRLKVGPTAGPLPDSGFRRVAWTRDLLDQHCAPRAG